MGEALRCLAIRQPWAWAVTIGAKDIENRSWSTEYRGPVVIQGSSSHAGVRAIVCQHSTLPPMDFTYSALIGVADLIDVAPLSEELEGNPWASGEYCWRFVNARVFPEPIPAQGKLNLYKLSDDLSERVRAQLNQATAATRDAVATAWISAMTQPDENRAIDLLNAYHVLGNRECALKVAERLVANESSASAYSALCFALCTGDDPDLDRALDAANRAVGIDPADADVLHRRAEVYEALGERDRARAEEIDPQAGHEGADNEEEEEESAAGEEHETANTDNASWPASARVPQRLGLRSGSLTFRDLIEANRAQLGDELELTYRSTKVDFSGRIAAKIVADNRNGLLLVEGAGVAIEEPSSPSGLIAALLQAHGLPATAVNGNLFWRFLTGTSKGKTLWEVYQDLRSL